MISRVVSRRLRPLQRAERAATLEAELVAQNVLSTKACLLQRHQVRDRDRLASGDEADGANLRATTPWSASECESNPLIQTKFRNNCQNCKGNQDLMAV